MTKNSTVADGLNEMNDRVSKLMGR
jgi:hypothetical protein